MYIELMEKEKLQQRMFYELENLIENLHYNNQINLVEYTIARDILWDCTENHHCISLENNIAQDFIDNPEKFVSNLHNGYANFKSDYPDVDDWTHDEINDISADYRCCAYN